MLICCQAKFLSIYMTQPELHGCHLKSFFCHLFFFLVQTGEETGLEPGGLGLCNRFISTKRRLKYSYIYIFRHYVFVVYDAQ